MGRKGNGNQKRANLSAHGLTPPSGLRGKNIGLWYAAMSKSNKKVKPSSAVTLDWTGVDNSHLNKLIKSTKNTPICTDSQEFKSRLTITDANVSEAARHTSTITPTPSIESDPILLTKSSLNRSDVVDQKSLDYLRHQQSTHKYTQMLHIRSRLPAHTYRHEIVEAIRQNPVVVISGETGSGKTTQVPQFILEDELLRANGSVTRILVTQPRRISALSVAERVANERGEALGDSVGYQVRLERRSPRRIQGSITFVTTGILLQWMHSDPFLQNVSHVIVDEVHEREVLSDFLLNRLRQVLSKRPNLRVVLMSATLNAAAFCDYFGGCPKLEIPGRLFPVQEFFLEDVLRMTEFWLPKSGMESLKTTQRDYLRRRYVEDGFTKGEAKKQSLTSNTDLQLWLAQQNGLSPHASEILRTVDEGAYPNVDLVVQLVDYIIRTTSSGAILVFLPGIGAIRDTVKQLRSLNPRIYGEHSRSVVTFTLHSQLALSKQRGLFDLLPQNQRKLIISTNIAETSVTIEDVVYVIDCGRIKLTNYDPVTNAHSLAPVLVSKANAAQRRGRAGRVQAGFCYHLFSRYVYDQCMSEYLQPEMLRVRLEDVVLQIKHLKLGSVSSFLASCINPPDSDAVERTLQFLLRINALVRPDPEEFAIVTEPVNKNMSKKMQKRLRNMCRDTTLHVNAGFPVDASSLSMNGQPTNDYCDLPGDTQPLTALGEHLASLPMDPLSAKLILLGAVFGCLEPALIVAACLAYRDPFEIPINQERIAFKGRIQLSQNTFSDHWVYVILMRNYRELRSTYERRRFCEEYFVRENIAKDILRLTNDYATLLHERGFIGTHRVLDPAANVNKDNVPLFRALICGALYPNLIHLVPNNRNGQLRAPKLETRPCESKVSLSQFSVNNRLWPTSPVWMVYFNKTRLSNSLRPTIMDTTVVPLRPLLFFSGPIIPHKNNESLFTVDDWIHVQTEPQYFQLIKQLRSLLDGILRNKYANPSLTDWTDSSTEGRIMQSIIDVLVSEPVPSLELQRSFWDSNSKIPIPGADTGDDDSGDEEDQTF